MGYLKIGGIVAALLALAFIATTVGGWKSDAAKVPGLEEKVRTLTIDRDNLSKMLKSYSAQVTEQNEAIEKWKILSAGQQNSADEALKRVEEIRKELEDAIANSGAPLPNDCGDAVVDAGRRAADLLSRMHYH